jgi:hypothetical protein
MSASSKDPVILVVAVTTPTGARALIEVVQPSTDLEAEEVARREIALFLDVAPVRWSTRIVARHSLTVLP